MIWYHQKVVRKGYYPEVGSVMVLDRWGTNCDDPKRQKGNCAGHVGIMRKKELVDTIYMFISTTGIGITIPKIAIEI